MSLISRLFNARKSREINFELLWEDLLKCYEKTLSPNKTTKKNQQKLFELQEKLSNLSKSILFITLSNDAPR